MYALFALATDEPDLRSSQADIEPTVDQEADEQKAKRMLDALPREIRLYLLARLDLPELSVLVHASPVYHQQYLQDRQYLLSRSIQQTLGSVAVDALAVHSSATQEGVKRDISGFLKLYAENAFQRCLPSDFTLMQDEAISIAAFHLRSVIPITERYASCMLDKLAKEVVKASSVPSTQIVLTSTETTRLTRATYRFQLLCHLASPVDWASSRLQEPHAKALLAIWEPWEVEELFSFYQFAQQSYEAPLESVRWDLHQDNPKFASQTRPPTPDGAFDLSNSMNRDHYLEGLTLCGGLPLLHTILFNIKNHAHLVSVMQQHMAPSYIPFNALEGLLGESEQELRITTHPAERDRLQAARAALEFAGDGEPDAPPLAWTMVWGGTYSSLYGHYIPDAMRRLGYVFWDEVRVRETGGDKVVERQWGEDWHGEDPREFL